MKLLTKSFFFIRKNGPVLAILSIVEAIVFFTDAPIFKDNKSLYLLLVSVFVWFALPWAELQTLYGVQLHKKSFNPSLKQIVEMTKKYYWKYFFVCLGYGIAAGLVLAVTGLFLTILIRLISTPNLDLFELISSIGLENLFVLICQIGVQIFGFVVDFVVSTLCACYVFKDLHISMNVIFKLMVAFLPYHLAAVLASKIFIFNLGFVTVIPLLLLLVLRVFGYVLFAVALKEIVSNK